MAKIRIQKALTDNGILSRRKTEEYIKAGRITVNGRKAVIGNPVDTARDAVAIDGERIRFQKKKKMVYYMLNKPRGYVTTTSDEQGRKCVADLIKGVVAERVYPVGRLDRNSEGLLLLTNDGQFANAMMHPSRNVGKTYRCTITPGLTDEQAAALAAGVSLEDGITAPAGVLILAKEPGRVVASITIHEGKNRQIRRMCEAVGVEVARLRRTAFGPLRLGMLPPGQLRELTPAEIASLKQASGGAASSRPGRGKQS